MLKVLSGDVHRTQVHEHEVIICSAGYKVKAFIQKSQGQSLCVFYNSVLICLEFGSECFTEANGLCSNYMHKRSALNTGEYCLVYLLCKLFVIAHDKTASRTAESFVRGSCHNIGIRHGRRVLACGNKSGYVSHVDHEKCTVFVSDFSHSLKVDYTGICTCTRNYQFGFNFLNLLLELVVINYMCYIVNSVGHEIIIESRKIDRAAVSKVTAVCQTHSHNGITGL